MGFVGLAASLFAFLRRFLGRVVSCLFVPRL